MIIYCNFSIYENVKSKFKVLHLLKFLIFLIILLKDLLQFFNNIHLIYHYKFYNLFIFLIFYILGNNEKNWLSSRKYYSRNLFIDY